MSGSDRGEHTKVGLIATALVAVLGLAAYWAMFYDMGFQSGQNERKATAEAEHYASDTANQIDRECGAESGQSTRECIAKIVATERESQRGESDLAAQWKAANWVMWAGILAGAQLLATAFGLYFVKRTLDATLLAVEDTGHATEAMREANQIAREAQRPWLSAKAGLSSQFEPGRTHLGVDGFYANVAGEIKNHGDSPATDIHIIVELVVTRAGDDFSRALHEFGDRWREKAFSAGPALFAGQGMEFEHMIFISQSDIDAAMADCGDFKMISPLLLGWISYRSAHVQGVRQTRFMYHVAVREDGKAKVIRPDNPDWWKGDVGVLDHETIHAD